MGEPVKAALVLGVALGVAIVGAAGIWVYFSPYQSCVRAVAAKRAAPSKICPGCVDFSKLPGIKPAPVAVETNEYRFGKAAQDCARRLGRQ